MMFQDKDLWLNKKQDDQHCKWLWVELVVTEAKLLMIHMTDINQTDMHCSYKIHVEPGNQSYINYKEWQLLRDRDLRKLNSFNDHDCHELLVVERDTMVVHTMAIRIMAIHIMAIRITAIHKLFEVLKLELFNYHNFDKSLNPHKLDNDEILLNYEILNRIDHI